VRAGDPGRCGRPMRGGRGRRGNAPLAEINIIPLVDVTLVLLIIFMATTAFVKDAGLNMQLPAAQTSAAAPQNGQDIAVALARDGKIYLDGQRSSVQAVQSALAARARRNRQTRVVIRGDESIEYRRVVQIMDMARQAGLPKIMLATTPLEAALGSR
jgi:biopolymer transport protein ExbD